MTIKKTPFQSFRLDLGNVANCAALISAGTNTRSAISEKLGMGEKKVEGIFEWAEFLGVLESRRRTEVQSLTPLGRKLLEYHDFSTYKQALEVLYAMLMLNHPIMNKMVNDVLYNVSRRFDPSFDRNAFVGALINASEEYSVNPAFLSKRAYIYLDLLTNPSGFGRLGTLVKIGEESYRIDSHMPDWRAAAYLLYTVWPENTSRIKISSVSSGQDNLGRIFLLSEQQVMVLLSQMEQENAIALEIVADLRQIGPNPSLTARDFLEML